MIAILIVSAVGIVISPFVIVFNYKKDKREEKRDRKRQEEMQKLEKKLLF